MTGDPERLLSGNSESTALERELLGSLTAITPVEGARERVWTGVARQMAALGAAGAAGGAASLVASNAAATGNAAGTIAVGAQKALLVKLLMGLGVGVVSAGVAWQAVHTDGREADTATERARPAKVAPTAPPAAARTPPETEVEAKAPPCAGAECGKGVPPLKTRERRALTEAERADLLSRESALLVEARAALRSGAIARAQSALSELEARFPRGMLGQEREVLGIELAAARGELAAAKRRARAFVKAHPKSPHNGKLARFLSDP